MLIVSQLKCVGCGLCVAECPSNILKLNAESYCEVGLGECINCYNCIDLCPVDAIQDVTESFVVAFATDDKKQIKIKGHFGESKYYELYKWSEGKMIFLENKVNPKFRQNTNSLENHTEKAETITSLLKKANVVVSSAFGPNIMKIRENFVSVIIRNKSISKSFDDISSIAGDITNANKKDSKDIIVL